MEKISKEMAEAEFNRFADLMDLDLDPSGMSSDDRADFVVEKRKIIRALCKGDLVINENGEPIFTPVRSEDKEPITFFEPTGASLAAMDRTKKDHDITKMFTTMADMTKRNAATFACMKMPDLKVCMGISTLFLG